MKNNEIQLTLEEVMPRLSRQLQDKLDFSVQTLRKGEKTAMLYSKDGYMLGFSGGKETIIVNPIVYWTDNDVWEFLDAIGASHCKLYDQGRTRIGCILCPYSSRKNKLEDIEKFPYVKAKWIDAIKRIRIIYKDKGILNENSVYYDAIGGNVRCAGLTEEDREEKIAQDVFDWWISGKSTKKWAHDRFAQGDIFTDME